MMQGKSVFNRIRNARNNLDNAERSFSSHQAIRGELDLMLAEAELQNLRQKRDSGMSWTRRTLAACAAVLLLAAGGLGWWWASAYGGHTSQAASPPGSPYALSEQEKPKAAERLLQERPPGPGSSAAAPSGAVAPSASPVEERTPFTTVQGASDPVRLTSGQMRRLIRSGKQELSSIR